MPLPEDILQKFANEKLEVILTHSNEQLLDLKSEILEVQDLCEGVLVHFEIMLEKAIGTNAYRVVVFAWDDGPAREEFPVMASAELIFEE